MASFFFFPFIYKQGCNLSFLFFFRHLNLTSNAMQAFMEAWKAACASSGTVRLHIPRGTYFVGPVKFTGPCVNVHSLTVYMKASSFKHSKKKL